jgi:hypothetical protein
MVPKSKSDKDLLTSLTQYAEEQLDEFGDLCEEFDIDIH